jgi:hypothetical protein
MGALGHSEQGLTAVSARVQDSQRLQPHQSLAFATAGTARASLMACIAAPVRSAAVLCACSPRMMLSPLTAAVDDLPPHSCCHRDSGPKTRRGRSSAAGTPALGPAASQR